MFSNVLSKAHWLEVRDSSLAAARSNMATLTDPNSFWKCERNSPEVLEANRKWVERAKRAHDIAMGRLPVFHQTNITQSTQTEGFLYAR